MSGETGFFKDDPVLQRARLKPRRAYVIQPDTGSEVAAMARTANRIGGLLHAFSRITGIEEKAALAVWQVESGGREFQRGKPVLRFEAHRFFEHWGKASSARFDAHFQFGGRAGAEGKPWINHRWRKSRDDAWQSFHGDQAREYEVFAFASSLGGIESAALSSSFGGPQILGSNFGLLGYADATSLFKAFKSSERWHVCGFFDYCRAKDIVEAIKARQWLDFAAAYNGPGQAEAYARLIENAHLLARQLDSLPRQ